MSGIYIHIPFCKQACHYCDFHFSTSMGKKETMVSALQKELVLRKGEFAKAFVETVYFGGGTPSVLTTDEIELLIDTVYCNYQVSDAPEITLEANPDDLSPEKIEALAASPVNRLSIGIQSFFESDLKLMNRAHNAKEAEDCVRHARKYFDNISIDLIYGIPEMSDDRWRQNVEKAVSLDVPHISSYALVVEPNTALAHFVKKGIVKNVDDEVAEAHFHILSEILATAGFESYEIASFGKPGYYSKNNTAYWQQKKYIGIGPSAHSYNGVQRSWNINNNAKYLKAIESGALPNETEILSTTDRYNEYVMTGMRTTWGVSLEKIAGEYGAEYRAYLLKQSEKFIEQHLLYIDGNLLLTTKKGRFLADGIASDLFMVNLGQ